MTTPPYPTGPQYDPNQVPPGQYPPPYPQGQQNVAPNPGYQAGPPPAAAPPNQGFPISTAFEIPGKKTVAYLGFAFGVVARSPGFSKSFVAGFKTLAGGEIREYTQLIEDSRRHAIDRMVENATWLGANAVIGMRFDASEITQGITEIVAYGTAVVIE